jgi:diguanylate cyclase (GGDEF)-like protein
MKDPLSINCRHIAFNNYKCTICKKDALDIIKELQKFAYIDQLTKIYNRRGLMSQLEQTLARVIRHNNNKTFAVVMLDFNNFKLLNDTQGHDEGDKLLKRVSYNLKAILRKEDIIGRLGGDEFMMIITSISSEDDISHVIKRIKKVFKAKYTTFDNFSISTSIGVSFFPRDVNDSKSANIKSYINTLIKNADIAMYRAKKNSKKDAHIHKKDVKSECCVYEDLRYIGY